MRGNGFPASRPLLLLVLVAIGVFLGACRSKPVASRVDVARITAEEVKQRLDSGEVITFVDSRSASAYELAVGKIPGAVRVPPNEAEKYISAVPRGNPVVVYCT
jgi:predicted sulfurtransferase